jgi:UDPglucose--hexose-1-phosphate uridylyltransferase
MELRKDYFLDRWVIIAANRGNRPVDVVSNVRQTSNVDVFGEGNESLNPDELGRLVKNGKWAVRWFKNKYPAVSEKRGADFMPESRFFNSSPAYGFHEVIVESPKRDVQLSQLSTGEIEDVLHVFARRIKELESKDGVKHVSLFKNHGYQAGSSIVHSHTQALAVGFVPKEVQEKLDASGKFLRCPYCAVVDEEKNSARVVLENNDFIAFCPFASRFNYEIWVWPKLHVSRFGDLNMESLSKVLKMVLSTLDEKNIDYNLNVITSPKGEDLHCHIEVTPRIARWGGFEFSSGVVINTVSPEDAAKFYRGDE